MTLPLGSALKDGRRKGQRSERYNRHGSTGKRRYVWRLADRRRLDALLDEIATLLLHGWTIRCHIDDMVPASKLRREVDDAWVSARDLGGHAVLPATAHGHYGVLGLFVSFAREPTSPACGVSLWSDARAATKRYFPPGRCAVVAGMQRGFIVIGRVKHRTIFHPSCTGVLPSARAVAAGRPLLARDAWDADEVTLYGARELRDGL